MTVRNPIVLIPGGNPQFQELPAGDVLGGAAQGPVGITWQGTWSSGTSYAVDDAVEHDGYAYIAIQAGTNQTPAPAGTAYWDLLASKGDAATIAVGTVTTGAAGSSASVTNSGSSGAAVFDFTIPRGDTGTAGGMVQLAQIVTSSSQASVDFTSIIGGYSALKVMWFARDTASGTSFSNVRLRMNNDSTAANYTATARIGSGSGSAFATTTAASTKGVVMGIMPNDGNTAGIVGAGEVTLVGYAGTTFHKRMFAICAEDEVTNANLIVSLGARWASASAISRLTVLTDGTAFKDGSIFTLYGLP